MGSGEQGDGCAVGYLRRGQQSRVVLRLDNNRSKVRSRHAHPARLFGNLALVRVGVGRGMGNHQQDDRREPSCGHRGQNMGLPNPLRLGVRQSATARRR